MTLHWGGLCDEPKGPLHRRQSSLRIALLLEINWKEWQVRNSLECGERTLQLYFCRKHMSMVSSAIFSDSPEMLKSSNSDLKTTYNTFQDCCMCISPMTFLEIAVYGQKISKLPKMRETDFLTSATRSNFARFP